MMVPIEKVFLRNQQLQKNPHNQTGSPFYKKVRDSMKKEGMINPLLCIQEGERYICCIGNNRWLAAHELGYKEGTYSIWLTGKVVAVCGLLSSPPPSPTQVNV